jgi:hypothetical protein
MDRLNKHLNCNYILSNNPLTERIPIDNTSYRHSALKVLEGSALAEKRPSYMENENQNSEIVKEAS